MTFTTFHKLRERMLQKDFVILKLNSVRRNYHHSPMKNLHPSKSRNSKYSIKFKMKSLKKSGKPIRRKMMLVLKMQIRSLRLSISISTTITWSSVIQSESTEKINQFQSSMIYFTPESSQRRLENLNAIPSSCKKQSKRSLTPSGREQGTSRSRSSWFMWYSIASLWACLASSLWILSCSILLFGPHLFSYWLSWYRCMSKSGNTSPVDGIWLIQDSWLFLVFCTTWGTWERIEMCFTSQSWNWWT